MFMEIIHYLPMSIIYIKSRLGAEGRRGGYHDMNAKNVGKHNHSGDCSKSFCYDHKVAVILEVWLCYV